MAQPAAPVNEDRTDLLGIPPFWGAAGLKDKINAHDLLIEPPEVLDEPPPKLEIVADGEDAGAVEARRQRDQAQFEELTS